MLILSKDMVLGSGSQSQRGLLRWPKHTWKSNIHLFPRKYLNTVIVQIVSTCLVVLVAFWSHHISARLCRQVLRIEWTLSAAIANQIWGLHHHGHLLGLEKHS